MPTAGPASASDGTGPPTSRTNSPASRRSNRTTTTTTTSTSCTLLPHGGYTLIPATLSTMAWIASLAQDGCDYSQLTGPTVDDLLSPVHGVPYLEVGFNAYRAPDFYAAEDEWRVDYTTKCIPYDPDIVTMDNYWKVGKAFEFLSLVLGGGCALFLWFATCFVFSPVTWRWTGYWVLTASVFQGLAFLWFGTAMCRAEGNTCALFFGSKADIVAGSFWFTSAVAILCRYPKPKPKEDGQRGGQPGVDHVGSGDPWDVQDHMDHNTAALALGEDVPVEDLQDDSPDKRQQQRDGQEEEDGFTNDDDDDFEMMDLPLEGRSDAKMAAPVGEAEPGPRTKVEDAEMA